MSDEMAGNLIREMSEQADFDTSVVWGQKTTEACEGKQHWELQTKEGFLRKRIRSILYTVVPSKLYISESVWPNWSSRVFYKDLPILWRRCVRLAYMQNVPAMTTQEDEDFLKRIKDTAEKKALETLAEDKEALLKEIHGLSDCYDSVFSLTAEQEIEQEVKKMLYNPIFDMEEIRGVFRKSFAEMVKIKNGHEKEFFQGRGREKWWASSAVEDMLRMMSETPELFDNLGD